MSAAADSVREPGSTGAREIDPGSRAALARLELVVTRRLDGILLGDHRGLVPGPGTEPGEAREYQAGDDVRSMDWSVTARTTVPHIRQKVADRELETWIVADLSHSVDVPGRHGRKRDLVLAAVATVGFLAAGSGNRIGMVLVGAGRPRIFRAAGGADHVRRLLDVVNSADSGATEDSGASGASATPASSGGEGAPPQSNIALGLRALRGAASRRGLLVLVSDMLGELDWERSLRGFSNRMELLGVHVADPLDISLPVIGPALLQDPATGEILEVEVDETMVDDYERAAADHRVRAHDALRRCRMPVLAMRTDRDWVRDVIDYVGARRLGGLPTGESLTRDMPTIDEDVLSKDVERRTVRADRRSDGSRRPRWWRR